MIHAVKKEEIWEKLYKAFPFEKQTLRFMPGFYIYRVPGGWIFENHQGSIPNMVFVPFDDGFTQGGKDWDSVPYKFIDEGGENK